MQRSTQFLFTLVLFLISNIAQASLVQIDFSGTVTTGNPNLPLLQTTNAPFTGRIILDSNTPPPTAGGTSIADFGQFNPIISYVVDGVELIGFLPEQRQRVSFVRQAPTRDLLSLNLQNFDPPSTPGPGVNQEAVAVSILLPLDFFGPGPYSLDQILSITEADISVASVDFNDSQPNVQFAEGDITSFSVTVVPIPAALPLFGSALGLMGVMGWRMRKHGSDPCCH